MTTNNRQSKKRRNLCKSFKNRIRKARKKKKSHINRFDEDILSQKVFDDFSNKKPTLATQTEKEHSCKLIDRRGYGNDEYDIEGCHSLVALT